MICTILQKNLKVGEFEFERNFEYYSEAEKTFAVALYNSRIDKIGHESVQKAINSLEKTVHHGIWAKWIYNFLASPDKFKFHWRLN